MWLKRPAGSRSLKGLVGRPKDVEHDPECCGRAGMT